MKITTFCNTCKKGRVLDDVGSLGRDANCCDGIEGGGLYGTTFVVEDESATEFLNQLKENPHPPSFLEFVLSHLPHFPSYDLLYLVVLKTHLRAFFVHSKDAKRHSVNEDVYGEYHEDIAYVTHDIWCYVGEGSYSADSVSDVSRDDSQLLLLNDIIPDGDPDVEETLETSDIEIDESGIIQVGFSTCEAGFSTFEKINWTTWRKRAVITLNPAESLAPMCRVFDCTD